MTSERSEILDLANRQVSTPAKAVYHFTKRELLELAGKLMRLGRNSDDSARLDALAEHAGVVRGTSAAAPAFRILGSDQWHPDLRSAIDDSRRGPVKSDPAAP